MSELPAVPASRARDAGGKFGPAQRLENLWRQGQRPDVSDFLSKQENLTPPQVVAILCVDQHQRWQRGERIPAETYLTMHPALSAAWADAFIEHCAKNEVPVDFVSSHVYGNDKAEDVFGTHEEIPRNQMVCRAVKKVHDQIKASAMPKLPLIWSEFNASYMNEPDVTDSTYMGPWMADTIRQCDGMVDMMSYWTFSDVFEEQGVVKTPFYGGFGLLAERGIPKAAFNAFAILHRLGEERLDVNSDSALVTRTEDRGLAIALWNLYLPEEKGEPHFYSLHFSGARAPKNARVTIVDPAHGSPLPAWEKMGRPASPTEAQIEELRKAGALPPSQTLKLQKGELNLTLPARALALIEAE